MKTIILFLLLNFISFAQITNDSGLIFNELNNTSPATANAKPLGVDAIGKVVTINGENIVFYNGINIIINNTTMVSIPSLSFNVEVGWYVVRFYPFYNSSATTVGAGFNLGGGTAVRTNQTLVAEIHSTVTAKQQYSYSNLAQNYSNTASPRTTDNRAYIEAHFQVTTAGTIIPNFRSENTGTITFRAGSYITYKLIN